MMSVTKFVVLVLVSAMLCMAKGNDVSNEVQKRSDCSKSVILQGCFYNTKSQLKEELLITDREAYSQIKIQWDNYPEYLQGLVCRCAKAAKERQFAMFGIKYWGECWGISGGEEQMKSLKSSTGCQTTKYTSPCLKESNKYCTGMKNTAYIYKVTNQHNPDPLDGGYSQWSSWSKCSKDCDNGTSTRTRSCTNPVHLHGGRNCDHLGPAEEIRKCNEQSCYPFPNKDCGTVKRAGQIDILNASDPIEFCTPEEFLKGCHSEQTFCRVVFPEMANSSVDYVIDVDMYNQASDLGPATSSAGIVYNAQDIDNFEFMYLRLHSDKCYKSVSGTYSNGNMKSLKYSEDACTPEITGEQWIKLTLIVSENVVSLNGNGVFLGSTSTKLPTVARGGVIARNGEGNVVEYAGYKLYNLRKAIE